MGFLNDTSLVSILNTTYLGPKRSLLVVKVHDKVLLLGNSETGLSYLSELQNVSELLKEGEKGIAGNNFDTTIDSVVESKVSKKIKLKENIQEKATKNQKSLSEQIKQKVKDLRSLQ